MSNAGLLSQHGRKQKFPFISMDSDDAQHSEMSPVPSDDILFDMHHCDEARVAKEVEAREKRIRKEEELRRVKEAERQKAAKGRATACRIRRQYMEFIEDEQLELMELSAMNKGLISIFSLDSDTLQQLDSFRSMLQVFPPSSVRLRRPFGIQPWVDSDENIANLLMPFDQVFLTCVTLLVEIAGMEDSRLLGGISVSLLKSIIKDIVALVRNSAITVRANQSNSANPSSGHLHIVEGVGFAYAWGFNIQSWQRHLNCLTWPEILRQSVLSAGLVPQLKKKGCCNRIFLR
ncbi:hypothetical protein ZIOFF_065150 [Zingiber officinale]|uniref:Uncharacterized protein n=1 Tax=Zingiber officinale TaxID=94328 RepID=A0A8J5K8R9_ZINOF|nr:hypothetical protein ZIOFF_065150 [Zingiber officinale]